MSRFEFECMSFLKKLLNPEDYGHAVTEEVRDEARILLGIKPVLQHNQWRVKQEEATTNA